MFEQVIIASSFRLLCMPVYIHDITPVPIPYSNISTLYMLIFGFDLLCVGLVGSDV